MKPAELGVIGTSAFGRLSHFARLRTDAVAGLLAGSNVNALLLSGTDAFSLLLLRAFLLAGVRLSATLAGFRRLSTLAGLRAGVTAASTTSSAALTAALSGGWDCE